MQHEFIFRGSFVQYWKVIFAQWKRSSASLAEPSFEISAPSLSLPPFAEYVPKENETLVIAFYDEKHWEIVAVFADAVIGKNIVKLTVFYNDEAFEKRGESAIARWLEIQNAWLEKDLIISPAAHLLELPVRSRPKPKKQKSQKHYSSIRKMLEKIAYRDDWLAKYKNVPAWSLKVDGGLDKRTANEINKDVGGLIKEQWPHTNVSGDVFANLIFEKYKHFTNLEAEWNKLKNRGV
jgi:hypothetical protein